MGMAPVMGKDATIEQLLPIFLSLLKDEFPLSWLPSFTGILIRTLLAGLLCAAANNLKCLAEEFGPEWAMQHIVPKVCFFTQTGINIKFKVAKVLQSLIRMVDQSVAKQMIHPCLVELSEVPDVDVRFFASQALQASDQVMMSSEAYTFKIIWSPAVCGEPLFVLKNVRFPDDTGGGGTVIGTPVGVTKLRSCFVNCPLDDFIILLEKISKIKPLKLCFLVYGHPCTVEEVDDYKEMIESMRCKKMGDLRILMSRIERSDLMDEDNDVVHSCASLVYMNKMRDGTELAPPPYSVLVCLYLR
ncbi:hypothetical protein IFM89_020464 [Coptis chinensis]|uniref:Uncharacterized protein n=1 Tax=Coptis chinensis TaxID=261450 RepID=A0A835LF32_9MAGN|nr:hypothetical protein IFM89_020464 [Coptis chinensis]